MGLSVWQLAIIAVVILVLFGRGRISDMMGDFGKGISSFKKGMSEEAGEAKKDSARLEAPQSDTAPAADKQPADKAGNS